MKMHVSQKASNERITTAKKNFFEVIHYYHFLVQEKTVSEMSKLVIDAQAKMFMSSSPKEDIGVTGMVEE